jgi:ATP-dependent helicase/nuclease subunit A
MAWTKEQLSCIEPQNGIHNILVSAGAGAGKTATLVEKIIRSITKEDHEMGINEVLCVTFTRDAAREMKERIVAAIEVLLKKDMNNMWLQRQLSLTETASIMTIDSFCLRILKDYISETEIDPAFRIADQTELAVLWEKVMDNFLEEQYAKEDECFISFADSYSTGKHDQGIRDAIKSVHVMAQSNPFPDKWIQKCREALMEDDMEKLDWMHFLMKDISMQLLSIKTNLESALTVCQELDGPYIYEPMLNTDLNQIEELLACSTYSKLTARLSSLEFSRMASKKDSKINDSKKEFVSCVRNSNKKSLQEIQTKYALKGKDLSDPMKEIRPHMLLLLDLVEGFGKAYDLAKKERNVVDFGDIEHIALNLLVEENGCTGIADSVARSYKQIYVDEYQDVNMLQEAIIQSVSSQRFGQPNVFMVGDVKQSIYKFRLARPELFIEKYNTYSDDDMSMEQKIELHQNFRSRKEVLSTINFFFAQLMTPSLGNIKYDDKTALKCGASFPLGIDTKKTTVYLLDTQASNENDDVKGRMKEAKVIADAIKSVVGKEAVYDKNSRTYRMASYKDIVILTRTFSGWAEDIQEVLDKEGVPNYADKTEGFFDTVEVQAVLAVLQVADNPMQDIPLSSAMVQVWGIDVNGMSDIVATYKKNPDHKNGLYSSVLYYAEHGEDADLRDNVNRFLAFVRKINMECKDFSIFDLLNMVYEETGYYAKSVSLPTGEVKRANLEMLLMEAEKFSKTSSSSGGIFQFVKYIETLRKYETEIGATAFMDKDATRITTIHKSKGLEFPIVILAGIGKRFNQQDTRKSVLVHQDLGVISDFINPENRTKKLTLAKRAVARKIQVETLEEELRILYVAMTRAKERLIMVGADRNLLGKMKKYVSLAARKVVELPYMELTQANSYLDWILMALAGNKVYDSILSLQGMEADMSSPIYSMESNVEIKMVDMEVLTMGIEEEKETDVERKLLDDLKMMLGKKNEIGSNIRYSYKSVAELKPKALPEDLATYKKPTKTVKSKNTVELEKKAALPRFMKKEITTGAERGTVYHRLLQVLDFSKCATKCGIDAQNCSLMDRGVIAAKDIDAIDKSLLYKFFESEIGQRMINAAEGGSLKREVYYMESVPANLVNPEITDGTTVIMQGVIDAYFKEEDGVVLVDYKSDKVQAGKESSAAKKHAAQIGRYRSVMEKNGKHVKEAYVVFLQTGIAVAV